MKLYAGDGPPTPRKKQAAAPAERPAPTLKNAPAPKRKRANLKRKLTTRQGRLVQQYGEDYQSHTGRSLSGESGIVRALLEENIAPASKIRDVMNVSDAKPDHREPKTPPWKAPTARPAAKTARDTAAPQRLLPRHDDGSGGGLRFDLGDALHSSWDVLHAPSQFFEDAVAGDKGSGGDLTPKEAAAQQAYWDALPLALRKQQIDSTGGSRDAAGEAVLGTLLGAPAAAIGGKLAARTAARVGGSLFRDAAPLARTALPEAGLARGAPGVSRYAPGAAGKVPLKVMIPTRGPLKLVAGSRPSPAAALSSFAARGPGHRVLAGGSLLAAAPAAAKVSEAGHALGTKIRGGAPTIFVDPSSLNPVGEALAAGKQPTKKQKAALELEHGPGRVGLTAQERADLLRQARANGFNLPDNVSDFELIPKAFQRAGGTARHLLAGFAENASDYAFVPAFAGAAYDATARAAGGEGGHPFVQLGQQAADSAVNALEHPIDNPLFAGAMLTGIARAAGRTSAKALRVKEQPLSFGYGNVHGEPFDYRYGTAAANTLTRPAALLGQKALNSPLGRKGFGKAPKGADAGLSLQERIMARQEGHRAQGSTVRATSAGSKSIQAISKDLRHLTLAEQTYAIHSHGTGSPVANAARAYGDELARIEARKASGVQVDEVSLRALEAKKAEWEQMKQVEANLTPRKRRAIEAFGQHAHELEQTNQGHLRDWGVPQDVLDERLWHQALEQHPTLRGDVRAATQQARVDLRTRRSEARQALRDAKAEARKLTRTADSLQRQSDALKGARKAKGPAAPPRTAPTHPELDKIAAQARASAGKGDAAHGEYVMLADGSLGVVSGTVKGGAKAGGHGRSVVTVHVRGRNGKITTRTMLGRELAGARARYRAQTAIVPPKVGKPVKRDVVFDHARDMAHPNQSVNVYPIETKGPHPVGVAKVTEEVGHHTNTEGSRRGFNESWRVVVGDKTSIAVPRTFTTRADAARYAHHLDDALARGDAPKDALKHADDPHTSPADTPLRDLPTSERKVALAKQAKEARAKADQARKEAEQHAEHLRHLQENHAELVHEHAAPAAAAAVQAAKDELRAAGHEPKIYVPQTRAEGAGVPMVRDSNILSTTGSDLAGARMKETTGSNLSKGFVDENPSRFLAAAGKPTTISVMIDEANRTLQRIGHEVSVPDIGLSVDPRFVYISTNKAAKLDPISTTTRLHDQAQHLQKEGLGSEEIHARLMESVFSPVLPVDGVIPAGTYYAIPKVVHDRILHDAQTEAVRRNLAPGIRGVQRKVTKGMISTRPATIVNNFGGRAMSAMGGTGPLSDWRYLRDPRAKALLEDTAPQMANRGISATQTSGGNLAEGHAVTRPFRWWMDEMRGGSVWAEDFVRGSQALHDLLKQAKNVQHGKIGAKMHRVNDETYAIAHGLRDTHPELYNKAIQHTIDFVGDFGKLSKLDPFLSVASPFWRWTTHILKTTLVTMPKNYPLRATLLMTMGEVGRDYQREHGIWPSWMQGAIDLGEHIPGYDYTKGIRQTINTSGVWPYATTSQAVAPGFEDIGINPLQILSNTTPLVPLAGAIAGVDVGNFAKIQDPEHNNVEPGSEDWLRAIANRAMQVVPTPYSFSGQEPTSLGPFGARYKDNGLPRRENSPVAMTSRFLGLPLSPVVTSGPGLEKQHQKTLNRVTSSIGRMSPAEQAAMAKGWQVAADGTLEGDVPIP